MEAKNSIKELKYTEEENQLKEEIVELCRVCESLENLIDISMEEFFHLNEKLHQIANFEEQDPEILYLKFICKPCSVKLENAFDFKIQCEFTYRKLIDRLETTENESSDLIDPLIDNNEASSAKSTKDKDSLETENIKVECPDYPIVSNEKDSSDQYLPVNVSDHSYSSFMRKDSSSTKSERRISILRKIVKVSEKSLQKVKDKSEEDEEEDKTPIEDEPKSFDCAFCNRTFQKKGRLKNHIESQHMQSKIYPCSDCGKEFTLSTALYRHREIHHSTQSFACDTCGKAFKTRIYLNKHKNIHSETRKPVNRPHLCHICGYNAKDLTHHTEHINWHAGIKPHKCNECGKSFVRKDAMRAHMLSHSTERLFICQICTKGFKSNAQLKIHTRTHTGEKKFKCKFCDKAYTQASGLIFHMRTHTGEKPYECPTCQKKFGQKQVLTTHMLIHTGERPHECSSCSKTFRSYSNFQRHKKICSVGVEITKENS